MPEKTEAFAHSQTRENLMRAFAGESQARNRYTIAAGIAHKSGLEVIQGLFLFTADQEKAHAKELEAMFSPRELDPQVELMKRLIAEAARISMETVWPKEDGT